MRRLVIVTDSFMPRIDGIAKFLVDIVPSLPYEVDIVAPDFDGEWSYTLPKNCKVHRVPLSKWSVGDYPLPKRGRHIVEPIVAKADLVWTHTLGPLGSLGIQLAKKHHKKVCATMHSIEWELVPKSMSAWNPLRLCAAYVAKIFARSYYNKVDLLTVPTRELAQLLSVQHIGNNVKVVPLGIKLDQFTPSSDKKQSKTDLGIDPYKNVVGYVGRLSREKGVDVLLQAFESLAKQSNVILLVVGDGLKEFKDQFIAFGSAVEYVGAQTDVQKYLRAMDVFVMPSKTETTALATLEAMACNVAPVATPVGAMKDYIKEKQNGLLFPVGNATVLALKLKWILSDNDLLEKMQKNARSVVEQSYNWDRTVSEMTNVLATLK